MKYISEKAQIGSNVEIGEGVIIEDNVVIKDDIKIGHYTIIHENTEIGSGSFIGDHVILGERLSSYYDDPKSYENPRLEIGEKCIIRSGSVFYAGSKFGEGFQTGCQVNIRERNVFGKNCAIGTMSQCASDVTVGDFTRIMDHVRLGRQSTIGNYVWILPFVFLARDRHPPCGRCGSAPIIDDYAIIGAHSVILPNLTIGRGALVGANSSVTEDVPHDVVVVGNPAKVIKKTADIHCREDENRRPYPWMDNIRDMKEKMARYRYELP